jgi:predicted acyltransferase
MSTSIESMPVRPAASGERTGQVPARLASIDAYRGFVMFLMMAEVLEFSHMAAAKPGSGFWKFLAHHQTHAAWTGCSLHDLIQPSFSFLVGVALPFSLASRLARGQGRLKMTLHAAWRAVVLVLLGVFLRSLGQAQTYWTFEDTLSQIGLGYVALFLLGFRPVREQWLAFGLILLGYWAAFAFYPLPGPGFDYAAVGVPQGWPQLMTGFAAHWNKNSNLAWAFDTWFLNLFPREKPFLCNRGGYATLSFIPTLATMILGLIAGGVLRSQRAPGAKIKWFLVAGAIGLLAGSVLGWLGVCPVVKRIWTPSWTLFSGGWCFLLLAAFYGVMDVGNRKAWAFPFILAGVNSIAAYCSAQLFDGFIVQNLERHLGSSLETSDSPWTALVRGALVLLVLWSMLFWMYRRKIFLRI